MSVEGLRTATRLRQALAGIEEVLWIEHPTQAFHQGDFILVELLPHEPFLLEADAMFPGE